MTIYYLDTTTLIYLINSGNLSTFLSRCEAAGIEVRATTVVLQEFLRNPVTAAEEAFATLIQNGESVGFTVEADPLNIQPDATGRLPRDAGELSSAEAAKRAGPNASVVTHDSTAIRRLRQNPAYSGVEFKSIGRLPGFGNSLTDPAQRPVPDVMPEIFGRTPNPDPSSQFADISADPEEEARFRDRFQKELARIRDISPNNAQSVDFPSNAELGAVSYTRTRYGNPLEQRYGRYGSSPEGNGWVSETEARAMSPEIDSFRQDIEAKARTAVAEIRNNPSSYDVHGNLTPLAAAALKAAQLALISFGAAAAVWDAHGSAERARALAQQGDMAGASREISGLAGRLYGGLLGFELGFAAGGLYLPAKIALGFGVGVLGVIVGDKAMRQLADWFSDLFGKDWLTVLEDGASAITRKLTDLARNILGDPIVLDLDGDGIELNSLASSLVRYDLDDDGLQERVGWVGAQDGLLFHDINGNGLVDGVAELFGSANVDGYDELKLLDSNNDTKISNLDAEFANLKVWQDLNQDGVSTSDEILTLAQAGIVRFNLNYVQLNAEVGGNITARKGSYVRADNASRDMASVWFGMDESVNRPVIPDYSDMSEYYQLPNLPAAASMPDLKTAMYFDSILKEMVDDLARGEFDFGSFADFAGLPITQPYSTFTTNGGGGIVIGSDLLTGEAVAGRFIETLYRWAGVDTSVAEDPDHPWHLQVFEAITGMPLELSNEHQRARFEEAWSELIGEWGVRFLVQAADQALLAPAYDMIAALEALDPQDPNFLQQASAIAEGGMAALNAPPVLAPFLAPFALLSIDPSTGEIEGDFDAFVHAYTKDEPEVTTSRISTGGGVVNYGDWLAWYQNQGKFIYSVAAAMNISSDAVNRVTGWRWMFGSIGDVEGTSGDDILEQASSSSAHIISTMSNGSISISNGTAPTRDQALYGYTGNDELRGLDGVDRLVGGVGDDLLKGGSGGDMYVYASGDGLDTIIDESGTDDVIYFSSALRSENLQISKLTGTNNLFLHFGDPAHGIILTNQWNSSAAAIEQFHFVGQDGLDAGDIATRYLATLVTSGNDVIAGSWASEHIVTLGGNDTVTAGDGNDTILGGDGDDALSGEVGNDSLTGGSGNDTMLGGRGADSYFYRLGDGDDVIDDVANDNEATIMDTLVFGGDLTADDLILSNVVDDFNSIVIGFVGQRGSIKIKSQNSTSGGIEAVVFSDESHWTLAELMARYVFDQQTVGHDLVNGSHFADSISSGNGDDVVVAGNGNDSITGGTGNDYFEGGYGADTYVYNLGDGHDIIYDQATGDSESSVKDTIVFGAGITAADLRFANVPDFWNDISISIAGAAGSIRIRNQSDNKTGIEAINFADGSSWTLEQLKARYVQDQQTIGHDRVHGTETTDSISSGAGNDVIVAGAGDDVIAGGTGNDYFEGAWGADTYVYNLGDGHDIIYDQATSNSESSVKDTIVFGAGITAADVFIEPDRWNNASNLLIRFGSQPGSILVLGQSDNRTGIETIQFSDGTVWDAADIAAEFAVGLARVNAQAINGTSNAETLNGSADGDRIYAGAGDDTLIGAAGDDLLSGGAGHDTYVFNAGDGQDIISEKEHTQGPGGTDTLRFGLGIGFEDFILSKTTQDWGDVRITIAGTGDSILLDGQDNFTNFSSGWSYNRIENFIFQHEENGSIVETTVTWADLNLLRLAQAKTTGNDTIIGTNFADTIEGGEGNDTLYGWLNDDTLIGGAGDDLSTGGAGNDTYVFNLGDGQDTIFEDEHTQGPGGTDTLRFGLGISFEDFVLSKTTQDWGDVRITIAGTGDSILLDGQDNFTNFSSGWSYNRIENFIFQHEENGSIVETTVTWADLNLLRLAQAKTAGNDTIIGTNFADTIDGGSGGDTLYGWLGNDTLIGGSGGDLLTGGAGNDTYIFNHGDGSDTIFEDEDTQGPGGTDTLRFGLGIGFEDFILSKTTQDWGDVRITIAGTGDSILLDGQDNFTNYSSGWSYNRIENFIFQHEENGSIVETTVTWADFNLLRLAQAKTAGNDTIIGTNFADTIDGGNGGDTLYGWLGNDTLIGGAGNDVLDGGAGADTVLLSGLSASYSLATSGGALIITDNERDVDGDDGIDRLQAVEQLRFSDGEEVGIAAPIILDLDGGGVTTLSASASRSGFDMDGDGIADDTSWMGNGEGMLFLDRDGDGTLSNAGEFSFVGDLEGAASDLAGLRAFDSNGDGILSSADDRFADFRIWRDGDGDGIVGQGEVLALTGADVQSLDLGGIAVEGTAALGDVVTINMGSFTRTDGSSAAFIDAALTYFSGTVQNSITAPISQQIGPLSHHLLSTLDWDDSHRRRHRELQVDWQYGHDPIANWPQLGDRRMWSGQAISAIDDLNQLANSPISAPSPASSIDRQLAMIVQEMSVFGAQSAGEVLGPWQRENVRPQFEFFA